MSIISCTPLEGRFWREGIELQARWLDLMDRLGVKYSYDSEEKGRSTVMHEFFQLFYRYSENHRHYHTPRHVLNCLRELDSSSLKSFSLELALWGHDVIYDTKAKDNELRSAEYTQNLLERLSVKKDIAEKAREIILATTHKSPPKKIDEALAMDIDLSILGKTPEEFDKYEREIRAEYNWVSEEDFREGRKKILLGFLDRTFIYQTPFFQASYELMARDNLQRSIEKLKNTDWS